MMTGSRLGWLQLWATICFVTIALLAVADPSIAQDARSPKVIELEGIDVIGRVAKPQVFYVLSRSTVRYEQLKLDQSFVKRILETARRNPF